MNIENINNASDKLNAISDKMGFLANMMIYLDINVYQFSESDLVGFGMLLSDLQNQIREAKELLD